jgi:hypothetical protein
MSTINPMDRFARGLAGTIKRFDAVTADLQLSNPDDARAYAQALQEMQMTDWANGAATMSRDSLLKKITAEIR